LAGVLAGIVFFLLSMLTFYVLGVLSGILFNPAIQNPKVIAVVQTLEPLPVLQRAPYIVFAGWSITLVSHALLFSHISVLRPQSYWTRL